MLNVYNFEIQISMTGDYSSTNQIKLLNLVNQLTIEKEMQIKLDGKGKSREEKLKIKNDNLVNQAIGENSTYDLPFDIKEINKLKRIYLVY
jgi:hypothetical protein